MEFAAPEAGEVILQLTRRPTGPFLAAGKPTDFDWDEPHMRARLKIPAGTQQGSRVRIGIAIEATGIGFSSTSNATPTPNTIGKSILRFVLGSQTLPTGNDSEYTMPDALALRIEGGNLVALGYKVNTTNANTEYANNLLSQTMSGPVRRIYLVAHGSFYYLQVTHDVSNTDSTQTTMRSSASGNAASSALRRALMRLLSQNPGSRKPSSAPV